MFCVGPYYASKQQIIQMRIPKLPVDLFPLSGLKKTSAIHVTSLGKFNLGCLAHCAVAFVGTL